MSHSSSKAARISDNEPRALVVSCRATATAEARVLVSEASAIAENVAYA